MEFNRVLSKKAIEHLYFQGYFGKIIQILEKFRHSGKMVYKEDSIFVYKYLGVIYGSDPQNKLKGEGYLYSLFKLSPEETLYDMHLSGGIGQLVNNVRMRFLKDFPEYTQKPVENLDSIPSTSVPESNRDNRKWIWGIIGGVVAVGLITVSLTL